MFFERFASSQHFVRRPPALARASERARSSAFGVAFAVGWTVLAWQPTLAATPYPLGGYFGNPNGSDPSSEAAFEANYQSFVTAMESPARLITAYVDYNQPVANWPSNASWQAWSNASSPVAKLLEPVVGIPMASIAAGSMPPDSQFQAFASGQYDNAIEGVVLAWVQQGFKKLIFRPGWEMNIQGPTYAGDDQQSQADWVAAFQHIYKVIKRTAAESGARALVVWNPNATNYSNAEATANLYPGDKFVDCVGIDMYADLYPYWDTQTPPTYHDWDTGLEDASIADFIADPINRSHYWSYPAANEWSLDASGGHSQSASSLITFALQHHKPIAIPETGAGNSDNATDVSDDPGFPQWLSFQLQAAVAQGGKIAFVSLWNSNAGGNYQFSLPANDKPLESAAWKQGFGRIQPLPRTVALHLMEERLR